MDDAMYDRVTQGLREWLATVASERPSRQADRYVLEPSHAPSRRAIVIERAHLLTTFIRYRAAERQLRCEINRIAARNQRRAMADMRRRIESLSVQVRSAARNGE
jgi:hypothetical protein